MIENIYFVRFFSENTFNYSQTLRGSKIIVSVREVLAENISNILQRNKLRATGSEPFVK